jgi:ribonucleoside-diphosphate reductase alpha chain
MISGSPYLVFIDNANRQNPECYTERGLSVKTSNLCSEIFLHTDEHHSFVCVLSSLNLARYDEYKNWTSPVSGRTVPEIAVHLLDAVVGEFIRKAKDKVGLGRSVRFAEKSRALGLGTMGLHTLYQKRGYAFKSERARELNIESHKWIRERAEVASRELAKRFGEPEWCLGSGMRHTHLLAVAPTRTNSVISGAFSQGIEPIDSNYFVAKQAKGTYVRKNPVLEKIFCERGIDQSIWEQILEAKGSVQEIDCLTSEEKEVFKTAREIDQFELIKQASDRQQFICQGQSLNLFVDPESDAAYIMRLHLSAWKMGLKSLYYLKSSSLLTKRKNPVPTQVVTKQDCPWCIRLKDLLRSEGINFVELSKEQAIQQNLWREEFKTVPQLWINGEHVGGYTDYVKLKTEPTAETYADCVACEA